MNQLNFIINLHISIEEMRNGGLMVLHKLAYELANKGHNVYVFTNPYYPHPNIKVIPSIRKNPKWLSNNAEHYSFSLPDLPDENTISIYTEIQEGNPYSIKYVTRWILYNTNYSIENTWLDTDIYFNFETFKSNLPTIGKLKVMDYNLDKLYNHNQDRSGFCYILHKNTPQNAEGFLKSFNATSLTGWQNKGYDYLREELNKYEYLLMFDHKTFNSVAALLCGTKVINLLPNPPLPPQQYKDENPLKQFGLAQGLSDITHANNTIHLARPHIESLAKGDNKTIEDFIEFWQEKVK
tara:strand:+ start:755 stop:1639 length:885 start_codon:yes stop_codon:yes gene_type:complete